MLMPLDVGFQLCMIFSQRVRHGFPCSVKQQVGQIVRGFSRRNHGSYTPDAVHNNLVTGKLTGPHPDTRLNLCIWNCAIEVVSTAYRFRTAEWSFVHCDVHFSQETPNCLMNLGFMAIAAGIMDGDAQPAVIGQCKIWNAVDYLPIGDCTNSFVQRTKTTVASGAIIDNRGTGFKAGCVPAANVMKFYAAKMRPQQVPHFLRYIGLIET